VNLVAAELILIGYWRPDVVASQPVDERWPSPADFIEESWDEDERDAVIDYLGRGFVVRAYMGFSPCRLCANSQNGALELSDGVYVWPEGLAHYVSEHSVRLPEPFVAHALSMIEAFEAAGRTETWWSSFVG
jgi:hypothetical protein